MKWASWPLGSKGWRQESSDALNHASMSCERIHHHSQTLCLREHPLELSLWHSLQVAGGSTTSCRCHPMSSLTTAAHALCPHHVLFDHGVPTPCPI
jgi:hypothetical protein